MKKCLNKNSIHNRSKEKKDFRIGHYILKNNENLKQKTKLKFSILKLKKPLKTYCGFMFLQQKQI